MSSCRSFASLACALCVATALFMTTEIWGYTCSRNIISSPSFGTRINTANIRPQANLVVQHMASDDVEEFVQETPEQTKTRIQELVDKHPVLLFMKGSKIFPQCGFSNTASQILQTYNIEYHTVDVLADENIRQGVKQYSNWPTIPQLYVAGEFVGGSDIMIEMYQSGELGEMIERACAEL